MSVTTKEHYSIQKNSWPRFGRINLLWNALKGWRHIYALGLAAIIGEVFFTFSSPMIVKLTIDSVIGTTPPVIGFPLSVIMEPFLGKNFEGGGLLEQFVPIQALQARGNAAWVWQPWLREHLWVLGLAFAGMIFMQALFSFIASLSLNTAAEQSAKALRDQLYHHTQYLPYETMLRSQTGDWLQRCTSDVDTVRRFFAFEFVELFRTLALVAFVFPIMFSLSYRLTLWGSMVMPIIILFSFYFQKMVERLFLVADEREGILSGIVQENVTGVRVVRAFARQQYELDRFGKANRELRDQVYMLISWLGFYWGFSSLLGLLQIALLLGAGLKLYTTGFITIGLLVLFLTYEQQVLWPVRQFGRILADTGKTKVALGRIAEVLPLMTDEDLDNTIRGPAVAGSTAGAFSHDEWARGPIEFVDVSFSYPDGTEVLKHISFRVAPGEHVAIVGPTGSGKSTMMHLLVRFYEPSEGQILIGGRDIRTIPKAELRNAISLVLQDSFLYGKTVRENLLAACPEADEARLIEAAQNAAFHHVAMGFQDGYETMVGERGVNLSGGQRQRLALARALLRTAPILILDDSTSAVDTETDRLIREAIGKQSRRTTTTFIIAHRLTTLAEADRILVLEDGRITAQGSHEDLIQQPGLYRRLAELQSAFMDE